MSTQQEADGRAGDPAPRPWWWGGVIYQIYPRSFADSNGDGVGDLAGIRSRLDYLSWLGVDAVWLSPFYPSPMADFGYDVADHCNVDPLFGTLDDYDRLLADCHERGIRLIVDYVPNHTSDQHPWFVASRSSRDNPKRNWYVWRDPKPDGGVPNNWRASFTGETIWIRDDTGQLRPRWGVAPSRGAAQSTAWTWDSSTGQYYLHSFLPQQPDLEWRTPDVVEAMHAVLRFWLDRGTDGFRVDAVSSLGRPEGLPDADERLAMIPHAGYTDAEFVSRCVRGFRQVVDEYPDRMMVGEVGGIDVPSIMRHVGRDQFHLAFNFPPLFDRWRADRWRRHIDETERWSRNAADAWPAWVLSNHDVPRHADRYGTQARARAAAVLLLTLRGTAFLYMGEELGLIDAEVPRDRQLDPGGRDGERAPIPWTDSADHGWTGTDPWLPFPRNAATHNVERLRTEPGSILHLYRDLLTSRRNSEALRYGDFEWLPSPSTVLAYRRLMPPERAGGRDGGDERVIAVNFDSSATHVQLEGHWMVEVSTHAASAGHWSGHLAGDEAVVLRPAPHTGAESSTET